MCVELLARLHLADYFTFFTCLEARPAYGDYHPSSSSAAALLFLLACPAAAAAIRRPRSILITTQSPCFADQTSRKKLFLEEILGCGTTEAAIW